MVWMMMMVIDDYIMLLLVMMMVSVVMMMVIVPITIINIVTTIIMCVYRLEQVVYTPEWPRFPKPVPGSQQPILHVNSGTGQVCITELRDAASANCVESKDFLWHVKPGVGDDISLVDLLEQLIKINPATCFSCHMLRQVFLQVALRIDDRVAERNGAYSGLPWSFEAQWAGRDAAQDAKRICEYVHAASQYYQQVVNDGGMVSGTCDESSIKGLTLSTGTIASDENVAAILPPQVQSDYKVAVSHGHTACTYWLQPVRRILGKIRNTEGGLQNIECDVWVGVHHQKVWKT